VASPAARCVESALVRKQAELSQESLFDFLSSTRLPIVSRLVSVVRWFAVALALLSCGYSAFALLFWPEGLWNPALPWGGALPALVTAALYLWTARLAARQRMHAAAIVLFLALFLLSVLASWSRGALSPSWYAQPILALLATCCLGAVPGLALTLAAVLALLLAPIAGAASGIDLPNRDLWIHATSLAALTLGSGLAGSLLHRILRAALLAIESQRLENADSRRDLSQREGMLRHAMRVETVGDLAGLVGHQLRNSFQVMLGHVTLGAMDGGAESSRRLSMIGETLVQARPLLDQLLELAHPDEGRAVAFDLEQQVRTFWQRVRCVMPAAVDVTFVGTGGPLPVLLDPLGLEHALWNLVINSRQAMPAGGAIELRTGLEQGHAWVSVKDTGCGIPIEVRDRVFDPYFTTKPPGQGTGLGLAICRDIVREHGGAMDIESRVGAGTSVRVWVPTGAVAEP
jgi:signal transduction histidine kinase